MSLLESICLVGGHISVNKRIKNPALNYQFEGTKLISMYSGGTYGGTLEVRTIEVPAYGMIEVLAHGARVTYGRLLMVERVGRAVRTACNESIEYRVASSE